MSYRRLLGAVGILLLLTRPVAAQMIDTGVCACHAKPVHNQPVCTTNDQHITLCLQPGAAK